jgi:two-component system cell cycle response regulator DivK
VNAIARRTILIIDETPDHRALLSRLLRAVGYHVLEAASGAEALDQARGARPDLILAALSLPGQPAWEAARQLRDQPDLADTPILGASVYNPLLTPSRARAIGCADYVDKPFDLDDLLRRITHLIPSAPAALMAA